MATSQAAYDPTDPYAQVRQRMMAQADPTSSAGGSAFPEEYPGVSPSQLAPAPSPTAAPTPAAPFDSAKASGQITSEYGSALGRTGNQVRPDEIAQYVPAVQQYGWDAVKNQIDTSPEAQAYGARNLNQQTIQRGADTASAATSSFQNPIRDTILQQIAKAQQPVDPNSPEIASTLSAARDEATRASEQERTALAERLYAQGVKGGGTGGLDTNALTQQIQQSGERNAQSLSGLRGQLLMNAYNNKHQQLQSLLQTAVQSGDAESARNLQAQIAQLQAAIQRESLGVNLSEFGQQLNQNATLAGLQA